MSELLSGSEEGWEAASDPSDSRYHQKQEAIRKLVKRYTDASDKRKAEQEASMGDDYEDAATEVVFKMQGNVKFGYSRRYSANFDRVFKGE